MSPNGSSGWGHGPGPGIGQTLKDARRRLGMDVGEAEERTKIRAKYLRALEAEDWEVLPAPAYVRGFLRTYGALLGLDGEMLADEFRRRHEEPAAASPATEPFLQGRRSPGPRPSRGPLIAGVALAVVALVVTLGLIGSGDDDPDTTAPVNETRGENKGKKGRKSGDDSEKEPREPVDLVLEPLGSVQVCVVVSGEALIDGQVLAEGAIEEFGGQKRYRVDVGDGGVVRVTSSGDSQKLVAEGDSSWSIDSRGVEAIEYAGPDCP